MADFEINKGVGREVEFKGLRAQYLFIFAAGLLAVFVVFVIMYMAGADQWICIGFGVSAATVLVWLTFTLNRKYGSHGLMKLFAARQHPRRILSRKRITWIPRSAFRNTIRHNKTTTPTILFSFPNKILKIVTNKKQNAIVTAIFTRYTHI